jgi:hypothetical protein
MEMKHMETTIDEHVFLRRLRDAAMAEGGWRAGLKAKPREW